MKFEQHTFLVRHRRKKKSTNLKSCVFAFGLVGVTSFWGFPLFVSHCSFFCPVGVSPGGSNITARCLLFCFSLFFLLPFPLCVSPSSSLSCLLVHTSSLSIFFFLSSLLLSLGIDMNDAFLVVNCCCRCCCCCSCCCWFSSCLDLVFPFFLSHPLIFFCSLCSFHFTSPF